MFLLVSMSSSPGEHSQKVTFTPSPCKTWLEPCSTNVVVIPCWASVFLSKSLMCRSSHFCCSGASIGKCYFGLWKAPTSSEQEIASLDFV